MTKGIWSGQRAKVRWVVKLDLLEGNDSREDSELGKVWNPPSSIRRSERGRCNNLG